MPNDEKSADSIEKAVFTLIVLYRQLSVIMCMRYVTLHLLNAPDADRLAMWHPQDLKW